MAITFETVGKTVIVKGKLQELKSFKVSELVVMKVLALAVKQKMTDSREWGNKERSAFTMVQFKELSISFVPEDYTAAKGSDIYAANLVEWNEMKAKKKKAVFAVLHSLIEKGLVRKSEINKNSRGGYYGRTMTSFFGFTQEGKNYLKSIVKGQSR